MADAAAAAELAPKFWRQNSKSFGFFSVSNIFSESRDPIEATGEVFGKLKGSFDFIHP